MRRGFVTRSDLGSLGGSFENVVHPVGSDWSAPFIVENEAMLASGRLGTATPFVPTVTSNGEKYVEVVQPILDKLIRNRVADELDERDAQRRQDVEGGSTLR